MVEQVKIEEKIEVVPLGIGEQYKPNFDANAIQKLNITKPFILHVGTLEPRKNIPFLLSAFEEIRSQNSNSDFQLVLTGKPGWDYQEILSSIDKSMYKEDIILTDYVPRKLLPVLYTHAECLVIPSHYEGFGLPVLEAMACGCPCLISWKGALKEVAGNAAMYFDLGDSTSLVRNIQNILGNEKLQMDWRQKSLNHASKYSWLNTAKAFLESLEKLGISS